MRERSSMKTSADCCCLASTAGSTSGSASLLRMFQKLDSRRSRGKVVGPRACMSRANSTCRQGSRHLPNSR